MKDSKICKKCGEEKLLIEFPKRSEGSVDGYRGVCKKCYCKPRKRKLKFCKSCGVELGTDTIKKLCGICKEKNKKETSNRSNTLQAERRELQHRNDVEKERKEILSKDTELEIWKDIPNYSGKYQASNLGRIRCMPIVYRTPNNSLRRTEFYYVKNTYHQGYTQTPLTDLEGKISYKGTHRWVMYAFHGESELQVDHINGIRDDNRLENLRYVTARENNNFRKDNIPDYFTSALYGTYKQGRGWSSYIKINKVDYYLGNYESELKAHQIYMNAWKEWDENGNLPEKYINPNKTSQIDGIDFHNASKKWRVRIKETGLYIGIFETENLAERVLNIVNYLISKGNKIDKDLILKIRRKYTKDARLRTPLVNINTNEIFYTLTSAAKSVNMHPTTLYSNLTETLINKTPIRYLK